MVLQPISGRWTVGADVRLDGPAARIVDARQPGPARDPVQALDGRLIVAGRPEAQVALPHQRLQQGVGFAAQARCGVTEPPSATDRPTQLLARQGPLDHGLPDRLAECRPVGRRQSVGLLPAGQLPLAAGRTEGQVDAALLRCEQVSRAAERVGLEDLAGVQRAGDIAGPGAGAAEANRELGRGVGMGGDGAEPADHVADRAGADRIQQVPTQPPR